MPCSRLKSVSLAECCPPARLAFLVIDDLTDPSSVPHELATTVPFLGTTPVLLLREAGATGYSMVEDLSAYPCVQPVHRHQNTEQLVRDLPDVVRRALESPVRPGNRDRKAAPTREGVRTTSSDCTSY
jgi:hypothetical protein